MDEFLLNRRNKYIQLVLVWILFPIIILRFIVQRIFGISSYIDWEPLASTDSNIGTHASHMSQIVIGKWTFGLDYMIRFNIEADAVSLERNWAIIQYSVGIHEVVPLDMMSVNSPYMCFDVIKIRVQATEPTENEIDAFLNKKY